MKKNLSSLLLFLCVPFSLLQAEGNCAKCERNRKYHEDHPEENYEYYEDYLKDLEKKDVSTPQEGSSQVEGEEFFIFEEEKEGKAASQPQK